MAGGRQREFDKQEALNAAMLVFWKKGYVGASLSDLTQGMGINKPSMYAAFGNKEELFSAAIEHYVDQVAQANFSCLEDGGDSLREKVESFIRTTVASQFDPRFPRGCFVSQSASELQSDCLPDSARALIENVRDGSEKRLVAFFKAQGHQLPEGCSAQSLALYVLSIIHGTAVFARAGKKLEDMDGVIEQAFKGLPF